MSQENDGSALASPVSDDKEDSASLLRVDPSAEVSAEPLPITKDRLRVLVAGALKSFRAAHGNSIGDGNFTSAVKRIAGALYTELNGYGNETTAQELKQESAGQEGSQAAETETGRHASNGPQTLLRCPDCERPYRTFDLDMTIPDEQWLAINHGSCGGVLCPSCMVARLSELPGAIAVRAYLETWVGSGTSSLSEASGSAGRSESAKDQPLSSSSAIQTVEELTLAVTQAANAIQHRFMYGLDDDAEGRRPTLKGDTALIDALIAAVEAKTLSSVRAQAPEARQAETPSASVEELIRPAVMTGGAFDELVGEYVPTSAVRVLLAAVRESDRRHMANPNHWTHELMTEVDRRVLVALEQGRQEQRESDQQEIALRDTTIADLQRSLDITKRGYEAIKRVSEDGRQQDQQVITSLQAEVERLTEDSRNG